MSEDIKQLIRDKYRDPLVNEALNVIGTCPEPGELNFCIIQKRAPSAYQTFIKQCLATKPIKGKPFGAAGQYLKECASDWRKRSGKS
jgi:hypothetical protein